MKSTSSKPRSAKFWPVVGFATLAGLRSQSAPAFLTHLLSHQLNPGLEGSKLSFMQKPLVANGFKVVAASEIVADKLPFMPDRTAPPVLLGRLLSGALVGATWYRAQHGSAVAGGLLGGAVAVAATYISFALRMGLSKQTNVPVAVVGLAEDALVLSGGAALLRSQQPAASKWRAL